MTKPTVDLIGNPLETVESHNTYKPKLADYGVLRKGVDGSLYPLLNIRLMLAAGSISLGHRQW